MKLNMPPEVENNLDQLYAMCEKNPVYIPLPEVAKFLGAKPDGIRSSIERKNCPFGFMWQIGENRICKIPTATFFLWYTCGFGYKGA